MKRAVLNLLMAGVFVSQYSLAADGDLDPSFGNNAKNTIGFDLTPQGYDWLHGLAVTPGGKIYVIGSVAMPGESYGIGIARMLASGEMDETFGLNGKKWFLDQKYAGIDIQDLLLLPDGKLLAAGSVVVGEDINRSDLIVCRLTAQGEFDPQFGTSERPGCSQIDADYADQGYDLLVQHDGKIIVAGYTNINNADDPEVRPRGVLVRLTPSGSIDSGSFGDAGFVNIPKEQDGQIGSMIREMAQAPDGGLIAVGNTIPQDDNPAREDWRVYRLDKSGDFVEAFAEGGVARIAFDQGEYRSDVAHAVRLTKNGSILVGGVAAFSFDEIRPAVALLKPNGELDGAFGKKMYTPCASPCPAEIKDMAVQSDGQIILAGYSMVGFDAPDFFAMRIDANGELDLGYGELGWSITNFGLAGGVSSDEANRIVLHAGRALIAGVAFKDGSGNDMALLRLESDLIYTDNYENE